MDLLLIAVAVVGVALVAFAAYRFGVGRGSAEEDERRLEEYDFYPFIVNESRHIEFSPEKFHEAVRFFLQSRNTRAARELIVIGEQNLVRDRFATSELVDFKRLYEEYDGDSVITDNEAYLENYRRIVELIGRSFPNTGIEILLHNLVNPAKSIIAIENGEVTGRKPGMGATNLVLDLKTRAYQNQSKLNYELELGARHFKCTTIPIFRPDYGLVGAICINIDTRFLREEVRPSPAKLEAFIDNFLRADFRLEENILSPDEYQAALRGKRHFLDEAIRGGMGETKTTRLAAIMFSDIADYTSTMINDEALAFRQVEESSRIHREEIARNGGQLLKEMGDGILASFGTASGAVAAARAIREAADETGLFRLRIGIHLGEITQSGGDVFGDGVNIASRIQGVAQPGSITVSDAVYANIRNKQGIATADLGPTELKHVDKPIHLHAIL